MSDDSRRLKVEAGEKGGSPCISPLSSPGCRQDVVRGAAVVRYRLHASTDPRIYTYVRARGPSALCFPS